MTLATGFGFLLHDTKVRALVSVPRERQFLPLGEPDGKLVWGWILRAESQSLNDELKWMMN
jgi:hypothetical protein